MFNSSTRMNTLIHGIPFFRIFFLIPALYGILHMQNFLWSMSISFKWLNFLIQWRHKSF
jgi:hypothetical protein